MPARPTPGTAARGAAVLALAQLGGPVLQAVQMLVVSRLLGTADVGRWTLPAVLLAGEASVLELGLHVVLSRTRLDDERRLAWRWGVAGTVAHLALAGTAWWVGASWGTLALALLPAPLLSAVAAVGRARLARTGAYGRLARVELEATALSSAATIATAAAIGPWSFVAGALGRLVLLAARTRMASDEAPGRPARHREAHLVVLLYVFLFLAGNVDYALAAWLLPLGQLGTYFLAFNVASVPASRVGFAINRVVVSRAEAARRADVADGILATATSVGLVLGAAVVLGAPALSWLLGHRWDGVVDPTRALGTATAAVFLANAARAVGLARDEDGRAVAAMAVTAGLVAGAVVAVRPDDASGVAIAVAVAALLALVPWWLADPGLERRPFVVAATSNTAALLLVGPAPIVAALVLAASGAALGAVTVRRSPP